MKLGLERTRALLDALGRPQEGLRGALVAGTNGKGSVCALIDAMGRAAGLRTVMLTKPHLVSWRERIVVDGEPIRAAGFAAAIGETLEAAGAVEGEHGSPTVFEVLTAAGVLVAGRRRPDLLVCEVGLGGRLDSTNVLDLGVAVITSISLDHTEQLGGTVELIAAEKAAIIKPGNAVVTAAEGPALAVVEETARDRRAATLTITGRDLPHQVTAQGLEGIRVRVAGLDVGTPLLGAFQAANVVTALAACRALGSVGMAIDDQAIRRGASAVRWPGRMQWIEGDPGVLVDGAHNPAAMSAMVASARPLLAGRHLVAVLGVMADKQVDPMLAALAGLVDSVVVTAPATPRAMPVADLLRRWPGEPGSAVAAASVAAALQTACTRAGRGGAVVVCGSLYVAGEALVALGGAEVS